MKDHKEKKYLVETDDDNDKYILVNMGGNSFFERVFLFGFSVKPTLKERVACKMFIKGVLLWSKPMEAKTMEQNGVEGKVQDGGANIALACSTESSGTRMTFRIAELS